MKRHVSMEVSDFEHAVEFYTRLFHQTPVIRKDGYAKWDVEDPAVNFVIESGNGEEGVDHMGIQVETGEELNTIVDRMRGTDRPFLDTEKTHCCYARQEKAWVKGMAGERWEAFLTHSHDHETYGEDRAHLLDKS